MTLGEILRLAARRAPRKTAVIAGDRRFDFEEYDRLANRFANLLISAGVSPGDRIASLLYNSPEYGVVHFGNARAGSVLVHIPPLYAAAEIAGILERTRPRVLVVDSAVHSRLGDDCLAAIPTVIVTGVPALEETLAAQPDTAPDPKIHGEIDPAAPVAMTFTGGTTGRPKGAVVSHTARFVSAASTAREHQVTAQDVVGVVTPMFHAVGLMIWYQASILVGSTAVIFRRWDPAEFIAETERHRVSSVFLVPVQVRDLLRSPAFDRERLASLRNIGVGGAPTPPGLIEQCREALPHCGYTDHYGQSETGPLTILKPRDTGTHAGTVGQAAAGVDLRIVDPDGNPVPRGTIGEVVARGPFLMEGYFDDKEETARYFRDGWGWTGDLAKSDEDGYLTLVGRSREIIISGGFNIHPSEVETALASHPAVEDCTVFGVPDERWGEAPVALVVPAAEVSAEDLITHCTKHLARYKRPREIVFVNTIPHTPSGKVQKPPLRAAYLKARPVGSRAAHSQPARSSPAAPRQRSREPPAGLMAPSPPASQRDSAAKGKNPELPHGAPLGAVPTSRHGPQARERRPPVGTAARSAANAQPHSPSPRTAGHNPHPRRTLCKAPSPPSSCSRAKPKKPSISTSGRSRTARS